MQKENKAIEQEVSQLTHWLVYDEHKLKDVPFEAPTADDRIVADRWCLQLRQPFYVVGHWDKQILLQNKEGFWIISDGACKLYAKHLPGLLNHLKRHQRPRKVLLPDAKCEQFVFVQ